MKAFQIQDHDNPAVVIAADWKQAIEAWRRKLMEEFNNPEAMEWDPDGVACLADEADEIILDGFVGKDEHEKVKRDFATANNSLRIWRDKAKRLEQESGK